MAKERALRLRQLRGLRARRRALSALKLPAQSLLLKLGEAKARDRAAWRLFEFERPEARAKDTDARFRFCLNRRKLREVRRREGRYLLRTNLCGKDPAELWNFSIQLVEIEATFQNLRGGGVRDKRGPENGRAKDDLNLRPIHHWRPERIEAHLFIPFLAYCLHVTLRARLRPRAGGLTPRAVLEKLAAIAMIDVHFPTTDGRTLVLSRYPTPEADQKILLAPLGLDLPPQPPPRITSRGTLQN